MGNSLNVLTACMPQQHPLNEDDASPNPTSDPQTIRQQKAALAPKPIDDWEEFDDTFEDAEQKDEPSSLPNTSSTPHIGLSAPQTTSKPLVPPKLKKSPSNSSSAGESTVNVPAATTTTEQSEPTNVITKETTTTSIPPTVDTLTSPRSAIRPTPKPSPPVVEENPEDSIDFFSDMTVKYIPPKKVVVDKPAPIRSPSPPVPKSSRLGFSVAEEKEKENSKNSFSPSTDQLDEIGGEEGGWDDDIVDLVEENSGDISKNNETPVNEESKNRRERKQPGERIKKEKAPRLAAVKGAVTVNFDNDDDDDDTNE